MRAIDGDRLKRKAQKVATEAWKMKITGSVETVLNQFIDWIDAEPTIEPRCETCEAFNKTRLLIPQPERKKGKWIDYTEDGYVECPFCHSATNCDGNKDELHFCFSCGADMREDGEEPKKCDTCKHEKEPWSMQCHRCENYNLWEGKR